MKPDKREIYGLAINIIQRLDQTGFSAVRSIKLSNTIDWV